MLCSILLTSMRLTIPSRTLLSFQLPSLEPASHRTVEAASADSQFSPMATIHVARSLQLLSNSANSDQGTEGLADVLQLSKDSSWAHSKQWSPRSNGKQPTETDMLQQNRTSKQKTRIASLKQQLLPKSSSAAAQLHGNPSLCQQQRQHGQQSVTGTVTSFHVGQICEHRANKGCLVHLDPSMFQAAEELSASLQQLFDAVREALPMQTNTIGESCMP